MSEFEKMWHFKTSTLQVTKGDFSMIQKDLKNTLTRYLAMLAYDR